MKVNVKYCSRKEFDKENINRWFFIYRPYKNIKGFIIRIFGVWINIRENNATNKLIVKAKQQNNSKLSISKEFHIEKIKKIDNNKNHCRSNYMIHLIRNIKETILLEDGIQINDKKLTFEDLEKIVKN